MGEDERLYNSIKKKKGRRGEHESLHRPYGNPGLF